MKKRVFSLALVLCMMLALVPALGVSAAAAEEYTTYEYVQTTGRQFVKLTGITTADVTGAQIKFTTDIPTSYHSGVNHYFLGGYDYWDHDGDGKKTAFRWSILTLSYDGKFGTMFPSASKEAESMMGSVEAFGIDTEIEYEVVLRNGYQKVVRGDVEKTSNKSLYNDNFRAFELNLFTGSGPDLDTSDARRTEVSKDDGLPKFGWLGKMYSCKLFKDDFQAKDATENSNMIADLVAAKDASGKVGILNKVDGTFYALQGEDLDKVLLGAETGKFTGSGAATTTPTTPVITVPATGTAYASKQSVDLDGKATTFDMYMLVDENGGETNYIKLRDIAYLLNGTAAQFEVGYDGTISLTTGKAYTANGSELSTPFSGARAYKVCDTTIKVNGSVPALAGITLTDDAGGEYNYFKLRDLGTALGFKVDWSAERGIFVATK